MRLLILLIGVYTACAVIPVMSMTRRVAYARTQYMVPCKVCTAALLNELKSPSVSSVEFQKKARPACIGATPNRFEQDACLSLLLKKSRDLVHHQRRGDSVHSACVETTLTDCVQAQYRYSILCDNQKRGDCHAIPIYP